MTSTETKPKVQYDDAFPKLPNVPSTKKRQPNTQNNSLNIFSNQQNVREVLEIPNTERKTNDSYDSKRAEALGRTINDIAKQYGVEIDISSSKNQALTVFLTGPKDKIADAKRLVVKELQVQSSVKVTVGSEYYRFIIGKKGALLKNLEKETCTKINIPTSYQGNENQAISITGPKDGCESAKKKILRIVDEQSKLGSERLVIPKIYHPFIRGPRQSNITKWSEKYNVKIDIPPPSVNADDIHVAGDKDGVELVAKEIKKIFQEVSTKTKAIPAKVKKSQHKFVFGPGGSGIAEILEKTGVSVEMPADDASETIMLRGHPSNVGRALTMVYERAESSVIEEIKAPNRFHRILIGKKGSNLAEFLSGHEDRVKVEFIENSDKIELEGPMEDVQEIKKRLIEKIKTLEATMAIVKLSISTKYKGFVVGRDGANIKKLRDNYNVNVNIIDDAITNKSEVIIEGDPVGIKKASEEIKGMTEKLDNEKIKDMIIEPRIQRLLKTPQNGVIPVREIYDEFPSITIIWSDGTTGIKKPNSAQDNNSSIVKIQGQKQNVDAASEKLTKLIKNLKEVNHHAEFRLYKEFRPFVFGSNSSEVKTILQETQCRIINAPPEEIPLSGGTEIDSQIMWIVGREKQVQVALEKIEAIQKKQANIKEVRIKLPAIFAKMAGDNASKMRSIREECDNVSFKFVGKQSKDHCEMIISGPSEALANAEALIKDLSDKTNEQCEECVVKCDKKYHGFLIGRAGQNISAFRKRHSVQLFFPDKQETDPVIANQIRLVGDKAKMVEAKKDLEDQIKAIEAEIELTVQIPSIYVRLISQAKRSDPVISRVRINIPPKDSVAYQTINLDDGPLQDEQSPGQTRDNEMLSLKIIGPKNLAEAAKESMLSIVEDMKASISKTYKLEDRAQIRALYRLKGQFKEWELGHRVTLVIQTEANPEKDDEEIGTLTMNGRKEQIELVYEQKIKPFLPIAEKVELPHEFHYHLVINPNNNSNTNANAKYNNKQQQQPAANKTTKNSDAQPQSVNKVTELQQRYNVNVRIPPIIQTDAHFVTIKGNPEQIEAAKGELERWRQGWEQEKLDKIARSHEMTYEIPEKLVLMVLERRDAYRKKFDVIIREKDPKRAPSNVENGNGTHHQNGHREDEDDEEVAEQEKEGEKNETSDDENKKENGDKDAEEEEAKVIPDNAPHRLISKGMTELIFKGYEANCLKLKEELDRQVEEMKDYVCECLNIPQSVHSQLIGARRSGLLKMQEEFKVIIEFPDRSCKGDAAHIVIVLGKPEDVDQCCDNLIYAANELLERQREREERYGSASGGGNYRNTPPSGADSRPKGSSNGNQKDLIIVNAPWSKTA